MAFDLSQYEQYKIPSYDPITGQVAQGYDEGYALTLPGSTTIMPLFYENDKKLIPDWLVQNVFPDSSPSGQNLTDAFGSNVSYIGDDYYKQLLEKTYGVKPSNTISGLSQSVDPNALGYSSPDAAITALPQAQEQAQVVQEADKTLAETLFPQGDFLNIRETATSPTEYNIQATKDLVENLPAFVQPLAPAAAGIMSLPYDAIQAYQRMQPGSGIGGFMKAYQAERPLQSAFERFVGASGPLAENINKAVSNLNPFRQQQYMQYAAQNPEQAQAAAQRSKDFIAATQGS